MVDLAARAPERILPDGTPAKEGETPANGDSTARDRIDARAPFDPQMAKLLRQANAHIQEARATGDDQKWSLARKILEHVLDPAGHEEHDAADEEQPAAVHVGQPAVDRRRHRRRLAGTRELRRA